MRLQKYLALSGVASRRNAEKMIADGRVAVNGKVITEMGVQVDELADKLEALRAEERELLQFIGDSLAIIAAVKQGFGEIYANLLEWRYIDGWTFMRIHKEKGLPRSTCYNLVDIAFDWIDSVGVSRLLRGQTDV